MKAQLSYVFNGEPFRRDIEIEKIVPTILVPSGLGRTAQWHANSEGIPGRPSFDLIAFDFEGIIDGIAIYMQRMNR